MKRALASLLAVMMVLTLAACGGSTTSSGSSGSDAASGEVQYKDTFTIATKSDQEIMDGQMNVTNDFVLPQVYSQLLKRDLEGNIVQGCPSEIVLPSKDGI